MHSPADQHDLIGSQRFHRSGMSHEVHRNLAVQESHELPWIEEIFGDLIAEHVFDGNHEVVLDDAILLDGFIKRVSHDYYRKIEGKNAFLVHFLDETYEGGYERYDHFRGVIRNLWSTAFNPRKVFILPTGYWNPAKPQFKTFTPASRRKYLWSFDGELRKSSRLDAVKALRRIEPHFLRDTGPTYEKPTLSFKPEYQEVLTDSAFAPAPMGNVALETCRMYEALELGSIPLIETRRAYPYFEHVLGRHPLPSFERWSDATAFVERYARDPAALDALQRSCLDLVGRLQGGAFGTGAGLHRQRPPGSPGRGRVPHRSSSSDLAGCRARPSAQLRRFAAPRGPAAPPRPVRTAFQKLAVMEDHAECMLVLIGATPEGKKGTGRLPGRHAQEHAELARASRRFRPGCTDLGTLLSRLAVLCTQRPGRARRAPSRSRARHRPRRERRLRISLEH